MIDPLKTSDDQKFRYLLQQLQAVDLQHLTDILYNPPATGKYEKVKQRLLEAYDKSDVKNFQKLISGLELGDQKPSQLLRKMRELASGMITEEGLKIEWLNHLPAQVRVVLSVNKESSLDTLAAMADKTVEYAESPSVAAVTAPAPSSSSTSSMTQSETLAKQVEKLTLAFDPVHARSQCNVPSTKSNTTVENNNTRHGIASKQSRIVPGPDRRKPTKKPAENIVRLKAAKHSVISG